MATKRDTTSDTTSAQRARDRMWDASHGTYLSGRAAIDGADALAIYCERRWGVGRLRLLVSTELRERFDRQRYKFNAAVSAGTLQDVIEQSARMCAAWKALDQAATIAGAKEADHQVWETTLSDGTVLAIVPNAQAIGLAKLQTDGRQMAVVTVEEVARLFEAHLEILKVKLQFPGATVESVRRTVTDPLNAIDQPTGLETLFNDPVPNW